MPLPRLRVAATLLLSTGCYRHVPVDPAPLAPGVTVRVYLTGDGTMRLAGPLGAATVAVDGRVDSAGPASLALAVTRTTKSFGGSVTWIGEHVSIPTTAIARTERRVVDRARTTALATSIALAAGAAIASLLAREGAGTGTAAPPGGPTP